MTSVVPDPVQTRPGDEVSVVMGTYNGAPFIRAQLQSILDQDQPPGEIVVSDDGSTDATLRIVAEVAATSPVPIRVFRNAVRLGFSDNFLGACGHATGRLIAFSDQDDLWYRGKLRAAREALRAHDAVLCVHAVDDVDSGGRFLRRNDQAITEVSVRQPLEPEPWGVYYGFTMLFEKALLERVPHASRGMDIFTAGQPLAHDRWVYFLASCFGRVVTVPESLAGYRQHGAQLYGGATPRSAVRRVLDKLAHGRDQLPYRAQVAEQRVAILTPLAAAGDELAGRALLRWERLRTDLTASAEVRTAPRRLRRARLWARNVAAGAYRGVGAGGLGHRHLLEDAVFVCLPARPSVPPTGVEVDPPAGASAPLTKARP